MINTVNVKNRSTSEVGYTIAENGIRRNWVPGEIKKNMSVDELEMASYTPGVLKLIKKYLIINDAEVCEHLGIEVEPEYFYDEKAVKTLLQQGDIEQLLDCLDFAPEGVIELIKTIAIDIKLNDVAKRDAIKKATNFDVTKAIENVDFSATPQESNNKENKSGRRAAPISEKKEEKSGRRTKPVEDKYKIVSKKED